MYVHLFQKISLNLYMQKFILKFFLVSFTVLGGMYFVLRLFGI